MVRPAHPIYGWPVIQAKGSLSAKTYPSPIISGPAAEEKQSTIPEVLGEGEPFRMSNACKRKVLTVTLLFVFAWHSASLAQPAPRIETQVVMLGAGTPLPDPQRSGPSTAILVNGIPYIVDAGTGVVRRAAAARDKGVKVRTDKPQNRIPHASAFRSHAWPARLDDHALDYGPKGTAGALRSCGHAGDG